MFNNIEVYKIWAQDNALWTEWAKPVLFANMQKRNFESLDIAKLDWISQADRSTAVIVDLPGEYSVLVGLALARIGYRPVPLYNGVCNYRYYAAIEVVPVHDIMKALYDGAVELSVLNIGMDAPPAFLLDSNRMEGIAICGKYDNRWSIFPQDMPSASYLISKGISNIIVRSDKIRSDLEHILYRYQSLGIMIYIHDGTDRKEIKVSKPSKFKSLIYRFAITLRLQRNSAGGFGGVIPESNGSG